jgi:hypothetical protein
VRRKASHLSKFVVACLAAVALMVGVTACGEDEEAQSLTFEITQQGKAAQLSGPQSAETGLAEITLENEGEKAGDLQLIRVDGDHSPEEVVKGFEQAGSGKAFPEWFFGGGGVGTTGAGESRTVTQVLEPGTYFALDTEGGRPDPKSIPALEVTGDESDESVEADETVSAFEYGFDAESLPSGETELVFENGGAQPHHLLAAPLIGDSTAEDVERYFKTEKGKAPVKEKETQATAVIEGGESQVVTLDLEPGRYALFCFISDRQGGPPHALQGMVDEVEVE